ncbi:hypothetical protein Tco_0551146 [Tanacetum coccineum]
MAAPVIPILSDSSEESVGSHVLRVILFGTIPTSILVISVVLAEVSIAPADPLVAPKVGAVSVIPPTELLDLVDYSSSSDSDSSEDSLLVAPELPLVSPFLCSGDSKADSKSEPAEQRPERHESLTPSSEFPLAPVVAPTQDSSTASDSCPTCSPSDHSLSGHTPPNTTDADTSTPPRFVHRSLARTPRRSEAFRRWKSAPLSTPYPPTTSESSLDSSSERSIAPTPADILPPRKRFRDSYSPKDSGEEYMEVDTADAEAVTDIGISDGVVAHPEDSIDMGVEIAASDVREDDEEFEAEASAADTRKIVVNSLAIGDSSESSRGGIPDLEDTIYDIVHYMSELVASGERASLVERIGSLRLEYLKVRAMLSIKREVVVFGWIMALSQEEFRQVRRDCNDTRRRLRRLESTMTITRSGMTPEAIEELINRRVEEPLGRRYGRNEGDRNGENGNGGNRNLNKNGRGLEVNQRDNREHQPPFKRQNVRGQNVARAYTAGNNEKKPYNGPFSLLTSVCFTNECRATREMQGHFRSDCPKLKDQNRGNKAGNKNGVGEARGKAYVLGADRSFVSTTFSTLLDITPNTLDVSYAVELADGRIYETNTVLRGNTLGIVEGYPLIIDPNASRYYEVLIVQGDRDGKGEKSKLSIISCTKTQKNIEKGCLVFLAQVTKKEIEDKSEEKRIEDVSTVRDFPEIQMCESDSDSEPLNKQTVPKFQVMPFRLTNAPVVFIDLMNQVQILVHVIDSEGIHVDPTKIESIKDWASPKTSIEIRQFLEAAFQLLKQKLCRAPILALPEGQSKAHLRQIIAPGLEYADMRLLLRICICWRDASPSAQSLNYKMMEYDEDEPSKEDEDDDVNIEVDEDEEEVHLALADSVVVALPTMDQAPSTEETEPFEKMMSEIRELHAADRRRQAVTSEMLQADHRRFAKMRELRTS